MTSIARLRKSMGLTQKQLAEGIGVTVLAVAKWETRRSHPTVRHLRKLAKIFDCTIDELLDD